MRKIITIVATIGFMLISCNRPNSVAAPSSLEGKWRMIIVKENATSLAITKPSAIAGDIDITFIASSPSNGILTGNTPSNEMSQNPYSIGAGQSITIPYFFLNSKVNETTWGKEFVDNIPNAQKYSFVMGGILAIKTTTKTFVFRKL